MDYDDYEAEGHYEGRILWGRMAVYGVAFVLVFVLGSCWGGRGAVDDDRIAELEGTVTALREENDRLQDQIDALSAGTREEPATTADEPADGEPDNGAEAATNDNAGARTYIVQSGDTLTMIAREFYGDTSEWEIIAEANNLTRDTPLTVGQELVIPPLDEGAPDSEDGDG